MQRYENNTSDRILPPIKEGYFAEKMQVLHQISYIFSLKVEFPDVIHVNALSFATP